MENKLLTKKDLADRWKVTPQAIQNWIDQGILTPCKGVPGNKRFTEQYIASLEGIQLEKYSPMEYHKMQRELEETKQQLDYYKSIVADVDLIMAKVRAVKIKCEATL